MDAEGGLRFDYMSPQTMQPPTFPITVTGGVARFGVSRFGVATFGVTAEEQIFTNVMGSGFVVALRYTDNSTNPQFNINFCVLEYRNNERR